MRILLTLLSTQVPELALGSSFTVCALGREGSGMLALLDDTTLTAWLLHAQRAGQQQGAQVLNIVSHSCGSTSLAAPSHRDAQPMALQPQPHTCQQRVFAIKPEAPTEGHAFPGLLLPAQRAARVSDDADALLLHALHRPVEQEAELITPLGAAAAPFSQQAGMLTDPDPLLVSGDGGPNGQLRRGLSFDVELNALLENLQTRASGDTSMIVPKDSGGGMQLQAGQPFGGATHTAALVQAMRVESLQAGVPDLQDLSAILSLEMTGSGSGGNSQQQFRTLQTAAGLGPSLLPGFCQPPSADLAGLGLGSGPPWFEGGGACQPVRQHHPNTITTGGPGVVSVGGEGLTDSLQAGRHTVLSAGGAPVTTALCTNAPASLQEPLFGTPDAASPRPAHSRAMAARVALGSSMSTPLLASAPGSPVGSHRQSVDVDRVMLPTTSSHFAAATTSESHDEDERPGQRPRVARGGGGGGGGSSASRSRETSTKYADGKRRLCTHCEGCSGWHCVIAPDGRVVHHSIGCLQDEKSVTLRTSRVCLK
jgi:hypothetical protein